MDRTAWQRIIEFTLLLLSLALPGYTQAQGDSNEFEVELSGYQEVPAVSTEARGTLRLMLDENAGEIRYELSYQGLEGEVTDAHIHLGQPLVNGGIIFWLCATPLAPIPPGPPPLDTPLCPPDDGSVLQGVLTPAQVVGPAAQLLEPGNWREALRALQAGFTYVNVHSTAAPAGEIRAQIIDISIEWDEDGKVDIDGFRARDWLRDRLD